MFMPQRATGATDLRHPRYACAGNPTQLRFTSFAQLSRIPTIRLNTNFSGVLLSTSLMK